MENFALIGLIVLFVLVLVFHLLVLLRIIPYQMVWGGRLKTDRDMYRFELFSLLLNVVFLGIVLIKANVLEIVLNEMIFTIVFWAMAALFLLNTVGNLLSKNKLEKMIFTPLTTVLTILSVMVALA